MTHAIAPSAQEVLALFDFRQDAAENDAFNRKQWNVICLSAAIQQARDRIGEIPPNPATGDFTPQAAAALDALDDAQNRLKELFPAILDHA